MRARSLLPLLSCCVLIACGEDPTEPKPPCGEDTAGCSEREHCDRLSVPNRCVCDAAYDGDGCAECAPGYRSSGGRCVADLVICSELPCGARGQCLDATSGSQACVCETGYTGNFCASCVDGYQDHDGDGVCRPSCGVASVVCHGLETCSDESGEARCRCAEGLAGPTCEDCQAGYRRDPASNACVPTCASPDFACSGTCVETLRGARCECEPGHAGDDCEECAPTHASTPAGSCVAPLPEDALLWTLVRTGQRSYAGALLPPDFTFFPVVPVADSVTDIHYDAATSALYGVSSGAVVSIHQQTGELTSVLEGASGLGDALTHDARTGQFFVASAETVWRVDPLLSEASELSSPGAVALEFDDARRLLVGVAADGERFELDPESGDRRALDALPELAPLGLAMDATSGRAYALGARPETAQSKLARLCRDFAERLGVPRAVRDLAVQAGDPLEAGELRVLEDSGADPPLVAYGSETSTGTGTLRVETRHPDALVCIVTVSEPLAIVVGADARFELLVVVSEEPNLTLQVEPGFAGAGAIHVRAGGDVAIDGEAGAATFHDDDEWEALGLPTWSSAADAPEPVLALLDWRSGSTRIVPLELPEAAGLSWAGEP